MRYVGENRLLEKLVLAGTLPLKLLPQGTLAEAIRAGGAGIPAFFTPTGVGTLVADGKEAREFDGRQYVLERALTADFAIIKAWKGDRLGNLVYRKAARNFNPIMATAANITIAEIEHLVEPGEIDPDIVTPGIYVYRVVVVNAEKPSSAGLFRRRPLAPPQLLSPIIKSASASPAASRTSFATASTSTWASASRPWCRTTCRRISMSFCNRKTACWASGLILWKAARTPTSSTQARKPSANCPELRTSPAPNPSP
jgi:hypothetical protein